MQEPGENFRPGFRKVNHAPPMAVCAGEMRSAERYRFALICGKNSGKQGKNSYDFAFHVEHYQ
jgi:hypothetical protein